MGREIGLSGSGLAARCTVLEALRAPRWEDYDYESNEENRLRWLGNGWSVTQIGDGGDPAWYLEPRLMNVPMKGNAGGG